MDLPPLLISIFLAGLFSGTFSCSIVQGGLLASGIAGQTRVKPVLGYFIIGKILAYASIGLLLGWLGSLLSLSLSTRILLNISVISFMVYTMYRLWRPALHSTRLPGFLRGIQGQTPRRRGLALGLLTILLPCGVTQWAMTLAVSSGNPLAGILIMLAFTLGTLPIFLALGLTTQFINLISGRIGRIVATMLISAFALMTFDSTVALTGTPYVPSVMVSQVYCKLMACHPNIAVYASDATSAIPDVVNQEITIGISSQGYTPRQIVVKSHAHLTIHLKNTDSTNCAQDFTIPSYNIQKLVPPGQADHIEFTTPTMSTQIAFMCGAGNFRGTIFVN